MISVSTMPPGHCDFFENRSSATPTLSVPPQASLCKRNVSVLNLMTVQSILSRGVARNKPQRTHLLALFLSYSTTITIGGNKSMDNTNDVCHLSQRWGVDSPIR